MSKLPPLFPERDLFLVKDLASFREAEEQLLAGIGRCIAEWSALELQLLRLTCDALGTGSQRAAIVYQSINGISGRINLVSELIESVLIVIDETEKEERRPKLLKEWGLIKQELTDILPFRNKLAHWIPSMARDIDEENYVVKQDDFFWPALSIPIPAIFRGKGLKSPAASKSIFFDNIAEHYGRLEAVIVKIRVFGPAFAETMKQLPKPSRKLSFLWKPPSS